MLPPPVGERGVPLIAAAENYQMMGKEGFNRAHFFISFSSVFTQKSDMR
jgi:hypothetical protein